MVVDLFLVYEFVKRLATPFNEWAAYKLGIIDERGNILKKAADRKMVKERRAFGKFDLLVLKLKKLMETVPLGQKRLASYAAALYLVKESHENNPSDALLEDRFNAYFNQMLAEEGIVNTSGGGNVAGHPPDEPPVGKKKQREMQKRLRRRVVND